MGVQPCGSLTVLILILHMLTAIRLDNQPFLITDKIHNEMTQLFLTTKLQAIKPLRLEMKPQKPLGIRGVLSQGPGSLDQIDRQFHPPPSPLPSREG